MKARLYTLVVTTSITAAIAALGAPWKW